MSVGVLEHPAWTFLLEADLQEGGRPPGGALVRGSKHLQSLRLLAGGGNQGVQARVHASRDLAAGCGRAWGALEGSGARPPAAATAEGRAHAKGCGFEVGPLKPVLVTG